MVNHDRLDRAGGRSAGGDGLGRAVTYDRELDGLHRRGRPAAPMPAEERAEHRGRDERLVAGEDDHVVGGPDRVLRHEDRVTGAERGPLVDEDR